MPTIDIHAHYVSPRLLEAVRHEGQRFDVIVEQNAAGNERICFAGQCTSAPLFRQMFELEERQLAMDDIGIGVQALCSWIDMAGYALPAEQGTAWARLSNETLAEDISQHDRFLGLATVPLQDGAAAAAELEYAMRVLGLRGVEIGANINGKNLDEPGLDAFWSKAQELRALILVHPHPPSWRERLNKYFLFNLVGYPLDSTIAQATLIFGGVLERFPDLQFLFVHGGGFLPYQIGRLDRGYAVNQDSQTIPLPPSEYFGRFYFDTVTHNTAVLEFMYEQFGVDRILLGTDYPFAMMDPGVIRRLREIPKISSGQIEQICTVNAERLLGVNV